MRKRGRPHAEVRAVVVVIKLTLRPGRDSDLIAMFRNTTRGQRGRVVMGALRGRPQAHAQANANAANAANEPQGDDAGSLAGMLM